MSTSPPRFVQIAIGTVVAAVLIVAMVRTSPARSTVSAAWRDAASSVPWAGAWGTAVRPPVEGADRSEEGFQDQTVRQVIKLSTGGSRVRIRLSNLYGTRPLRVEGATLGRSAGGPVVRPGSLRRLTFDDRDGVVIPAGRDAVSDALAFPTSSLERLTISLRFTEHTGRATFHRYAMATSYSAQGDHLADPGGDAYTRSSGSWYFLSGVEVAGGPVARERNTVVAFGGAFVDGVGSTSGADRRFPDRLAERLADNGRALAVVNAGIDSGRLLSGSDCAGEKGLTRFRRDVLDRPGVRSVIVSLGANDIGAARSGGPCEVPYPPATAEQIIAGHRTLIRAAHAEDIEVIGMTIPPMKATVFPYWSREGERIRRKVNHWIRTSGSYDSVADAARAMASPADPRLPRTDRVYVDGLHPNDAGHRAIAGTVDLNAL